MQKSAVSRSAKDKVLLNAAQILPISCHCNRARNNVIASSKRAYYIVRLSMRKFRTRIDSTILSFDRVLVFSDLLNVTKFSSQNRLYCEQAYPFICYKLYFIDQTHTLMWRGKFCHCEILIDKCSKRVDDV